MSDIVALSSVDTKVWQILHYGSVQRLLFIKMNAVNSCMSVVDVASYV